MTELTPEKALTLEYMRECAEMARRTGYPVLAGRLDGFASAWEADRKTLGAAIATLNYETKRLDAAQARIEALERENRALRANVSKSVLRRLEGQGVLRGEEER